MIVFETPGEILEYSLLSSWAELRVLTDAAIENALNAPRQYHWPKRRRISENQYCGAQTQRSK